MGGEGSVGSIAGGRGALLIASVGNPGFGDGGFEPPHGKALEGWDGALVPSTGPASKSRWTDK